MGRGRSLVCLMRWMALPALAAFLAATSAFAQTAPQKQAKPPTSIAVPAAEPENAQEYGSPIGPPPSGPTAADRGPAQKHFVLASATDNLASTQIADNASMAVPEKISLDKRISVPLIHDVQNDTYTKVSDNPALAYELTYLNWGVVTGEQLQARHGHYFTITSVNHGPRGDFTARFEYRQVKSQEIIRTLTQPLPHFSGAARSYFGVVDKAYLAYGPVCSWRFSILKGDTIVAQTRSFIW